MKYHITIILCFTSLISLCQPGVYTSDIDNFWTAYDSVQSTTDSTRQIAFIQTLYVDKGTPGLKAFMQARNYTPELWLLVIKKLPHFWQSIRPNTLYVKNLSGQIEESIARFRELYPALKPATLYFTIGALRSGGTTYNDMVLIGTEIAAATAATDVSDFKNPWLPGVFKEQSLDRIIELNIHEYVHTQQRGNGKTLLGSALKEGACDFIAELVTNKPLKTNYIIYGYAHEDTVKAAFRKEMLQADYSNWLSNGSNAKTVADLGYFMGYVICKAYYNNATDKKKAIRDIIELNYSNQEKVAAFLERSGYYK